MATSIGTTGITFPDATVQTTAFSGSGGGGFNGATTTSSAVDITLTSGSAQTQVVTMTATNKYVNLPSATTLTSKGGPIYIIQNKGTIPFGIKNNAGTIVSNVNYGESVQLVLTDNSTAAGTWSVTTRATIAGVGPVNVSTIQPPVYNAYGNITVCALSSTQALICYIGGSGLTLYGVLVSISGTTVTYGTPVTINASATNAYAFPITCVALSSTSAIVGYSVNNNTYRVNAMTISGSTLTVGATTNIIVSNLATANCVLMYDSSTTALVGYAYDDGTNNYAGVRVIGVSGTSITANNNYFITPAGTGANIPMITRLSANTYVALTSSQATAFTTSGTTLTVGSSLTTTYPSYAIYMAYMNNGLNVRIIQGYAATSTCAVYTDNQTYAVIGMSAGAPANIYMGYLPEAVMMVGNYGNVNGQTMQWTFGSPMTALSSSAGLVVSSSGALYAISASSSGFGGRTYIGQVSMINTGGAAALDSTTNIVTGLTQGYLATAIVKGF